MHFMPLLFVAVCSHIYIMRCVITVTVGLIPGRISFSLFYFVPVLSFVQFPDYERANHTQVQITERTLTR